MDRIDPKLLGEICKKLGRSERTADRRIKKIQRRQLLERPLAALTLAIELGINIDKYAMSEDLEKLRSAQKINPLPISSKISNPLPRNEISTRKNLRISAPAGVDSDSFISDTDKTSAKSNAELYPALYLFENSVRRFISLVMKFDYGENWWEDKIENDKPKLADSVKIRRNDEKNFPWHSKRNAEPIYYTDITDLTNIINTYSPKGKFKTAFGKHQARVLVWIEDIEKTRNILAHNNPVSKIDRDRLQKYARDWHIFVTEARKSLLK